MRPLLRNLTPLGALEPPEAALAAAGAAMLADNHPKALAAVMRGSEQLLQITDSNLQVNAMPTLAIVGDRDPSIESVHRLAAVMANLDVVEIPGADHTTAVGEVFIEHLVAFLDQHRSNE